MKITGFIASNNFIVVNKDLIKALGLEEAVLIGELASEYRYWQQQNAIDKDGYFYSTSENVEENTGLKEGRQRAIVKRLVAAHVIDVKVKGLPAKRHFRINEEILLQLLSINTDQNEQTSSAEFAELEPSKTQGNNNNLKTITKNNKELYINIIDYLNQKAGMAFRHGSKTTQQHINARIAEGFTLEDFKTVIDKKCADWIGTDFEQYLRPATLFGSKFENYLNAPLRQAKQYGKTGIEITKPDVDDLDDIF